MQLAGTVGLHWQGRKLSVRRKWSGKGRQARGGVEPCTCGRQGSLVSGKQREVGYVSVEGLLKVADFRVKPATIRKKCPVSLTYGITVAICFMPVAVKKKKKHL